ncbi:peptide chain release factor N(5)-glutamine methyltransferase [Mucilaginibacter phyllosphaerae]
MKTIKDVFLSFQQSLAEVYDRRETEAIALLVLEEITDLSRSKIKAFTEDEITGEASEKIHLILEELKTGKPVQYILGTTEFYGLNFLVNPATLIPRPETEELVQWVLEESKKLKIKNQKPLPVLDIGTGSGCIAISVKKNLPEAVITAIDISPEALHMAIKNALINDVEVEFIHDDILKTQSVIVNSTYDIIISNPPYVTLDDKLLMHQNVTNFEPHNALFVPQNDPLVFYKAIADFAVGRLSNNGLLFFEINENFGKETIELLSNKGFINTELRQDMSGRDRMIMACAPPKPF